MTTKLSGLPEPRWISIVVSPPRTAVMKGIVRCASMARPVRWRPGRPPRTRPMMSSKMLAPPACSASADTAKSAEQVRQINVLEPGFAAKA